jgi:hypothetical protein
MGNWPLALTMLSLLVGILTAVPGALAVEIGVPAPNFKLPSTTGADISLSDFKGKKVVLLEFYGLDFAPA